MNVPTPNRSLIESLVRDTLFRELKKSAPERQAPVLVVNASARHMHISQDDLVTLFGPGTQLSVHKWLYQEGQFASTETVTLIGPRRRIIPNLRILGPCRNLTQVELAYTDAVQLGIDVPVRQSGDIEGTPGGYIIGPKGMVEMKKGIIRAARHAHMNPSDAEFYGIKNKDMAKLRVTANTCSTVFEDILVRVDPSFKLEVHIDTDEANACDLEHATKVELFR